MKKQYFILLFFLFMTNEIYAQEFREEAEAMEIVNSQDSISRTVFLDETILPAGMQKMESNTKQVWMVRGDAVNGIKHLADVRLKFPTQDSALAFHRKFLAVNSEYGPEIVQHNLQYSGAVEFKLYKGDAFFNEQFALMGLQVFCYLFVVDNYFAKIYLLCNKTAVPENFQHLVTAAIERIQQPGN